MGCLNITSSELKKQLKGRTPEQQTAIKYFFGKGGCLDKSPSDEEYESLVMAKAQSVDFKKKALDKIGIDESQVNEVAPVHFEGYVLDDDARGKRGNDDVYRTSKYQISWLFFSSSQVYFYQYTFDMRGEDKVERTEEYFYKDITNLNTTSDTVEVKYDKTNCIGKATEVRLNVNKNCFVLSAMGGDKMVCAMKQNDYTEKAIQGMKAKLREKKG